MADPSTANPSEPDPSANPHPENSHNTGNPDPSDTGQKPLDPTEILRQAASGEEDQKPQKLKLKQILTPLSPHLKAPRPKVEKRVESKTAYKPSPKAVPVEPEPELTPEELAAREKIMPPGESKESPEGESSPPVEGESSPEEDTADSQEEPNAEESGEVEPAKKPAATPAAKRSKGKLITTVSVPLVLVVAILLLVHFIFDPLGTKITPIEELPDLVLQEGARGTVAQGESENSGASNLLEVLESESLESYLAQLGQQSMTRSRNPAGIFVNSVFFAEGSQVNPRYGLRLVAIEADRNAILLEDENGQSHRVTLP